MTLHPKLSQALCVAGLGGPGLASQPWKGLWCNPGEVHRKSCPKGRLFAFAGCQHSMAARTPGRRHSANPTGGVRRHLPLHKGGFFALVHTTGPGSVAQRGSAVWERRHSANPTGGVRRHLPLHKGGFFALVHTTGPGSVAQRGSAVWVQRHAA